MADRYPDAELLARSVLLGLDTTGLRVGTEVPADPNGTYTWLPFLRVQCFGGADDGVTDTSRISVDAFAATKAAAAELAEDARQLITSGAFVTSVGAADLYVTTLKPNQVPYGDEKRVIRYTASYSGQARRS